MITDVEVAEKELRKAEKFLEESEKIAECKESEGFALLYRHIVTDRVSKIQSLMVVETDKEKFDKLAYELFSISGLKRVLDQQLSIDIVESNILDLKEFISKEKRNGN